MASKIDLYKTAGKQFLNGLAMEEIKQPAFHSYSAKPGFIQKPGIKALTLPFFLLTLPIFIVVHLEREYHHLITYRFVYKEILLLFAASPIIFLLSLLLFRDSRRASLYAFFLLIIFYFFCDLKDGLQKVTGGAFISKYIFLLPLILVSVIVLFFIVKKITSNFSKFFLYINILFLVFIAIDFISMLFNSNGQNDVGDRSKRLYKQYKSCKECNKPDIYYVVFDEYTSSKLLASEFGFHNEIDSFLIQKGFRVIPYSKSNYNLTPFSIASCFNLNYLPGLNVNKDFYLVDYLPGLPTVYKSELVPMLEKQGYEIFNHSIFNIENHPSFYPPYDLWELKSLYQRHNMFRKIDGDIGWLLRKWFALPQVSDIQRNYISERDKYQVATLKNLEEAISRRSTRPKFVYTHFMIPHQPYSYDSLGRKIPFPELAVDYAQIKIAYVNQILFTNRVMKQVVEEIFSGSTRPFVMIIQGDHGFKNGQKEKRDSEFGNLNAFYFYNKDYHLLRDSMSNVNTFRVVFNTFFSQDFEMLKDTSYFLQYK